MVQQCKRQDAAEHKLEQALFVRRMQALKWGDLHGRAATAPLAVRTMIVLSVLLLLWEDEKDKHKEQRSRNIGVWLSWTASCNGGATAVRGNRLTPSTYGTITLLVLRLAVATKPGVRGHREHTCFTAAAAQRTQSLPRQVCLIKALGDLVRVP